MKNGDYQKFLDDESIYKLGNREHVVFRFPNMKGVFKFSFNQEGYPEARTQEIDRVSCNYYNAPINAIREKQRNIDDYPSRDFMGIYDYHTLGILQYFNGDYATAQETLEKSIAVNAEFADTYYYLALVEEELGNATAAQQRLQESINRFEGREGGYTGYPFCFPVTWVVVEEKLAG
jgi:tetratricopeptide (TPR) repeat protein